MTKQKRYQYTPRETQFDVNELNTTHVQLWRHHIMFTLVPLERAKEMVRNREAFVCTNQSINAMDVNGFAE